MKKYYFLFVVFCLLSIAFTIWSMTGAADTYAYSVSNGVIKILLWSLLVLIAVRSVLAVPKPERKWQYWLFPFLAFLPVALNVADMIRKIAGMP